ncbi:hypothetical protein M878_19395 [Streptomyces roseochromogenus subsp. oscitans DS 12.976]|uniref:Uncharacterized protein n=1 Tax=Streptomyces roseochromogenus subsp. oscitans DS 12.976 TaxID=1352936 RepID=V6KCM4_STRRC|nr:hypothetical protein M878_19395 [Streptomyces roseochromogenus subsp. oscitans DS 12.976]
MTPTIRQQIDTADLLLADVGGPTMAGPVTVVSASPTVLTATAASRYRGAAFAAGRVRGCGRRQPHRP